MRLDASLVPLFAWPVDDLLSALPAADDPVWNRFAARQQRFAMHAATRSIAIVWTEELSGESEPAVFAFDHASPALRSAAYACADRLVEALGGGKVTRLMLVELPAGASVKPHRDLAPVITRVHRCHVPIETNDQVSFFVDDVDHRLAAGQAYEFDNTRRHAVENRGDSRRVHLICDILPVDG